MILVTVGTTDFDPLVRRMDELAPRLGEEVVCQIARGAYTPRNCAYFRFVPHLEEYLHPARLVVSHGGLGSVIEVIRLGKPLVGVSNPDRLDLHQDDLLGTLESRNYILWCRSLDRLAEDINRAASMQFAQYIDPPCHIQTVIRNFMSAETTSPRARSFRGMLTRFGL
jgi:beta-1,4-N-acetylglucosaminyltransferase